MRSVERAVARGAPSRDLAPASAALVAAWMLAILGIAGVAFRAESIPLASLFLAGLAAFGPLWPREHLAVAKYATTTITAANGSLLVFLASLAFNALTPENPSIGEADARWILITAAAALVSAVGAGVVVRRAQLHDGYQRWMESEQITSIGRQLAALEAAGGQPLVRGRGTRRVTWLLVGLAVVVGASRVNRRLS